MSTEAVAIPGMLFRGRRLFLEKRPGEIGDIAVKRDGMAFVRGLHQLDREKKSEEGGLILPFVSN